MVVTDHSLPIQVQAHVEYEARFTGHTTTSRLSYAIFDSGADSCIVGKMAKVMALTNRTANLVGYDPQTTKSASLPVVTALLKTVSKKNVPILL